METQDTDPSDRDPPKEHGIRDRDPHPMDREPSMETLGHRPPRTKTPPPPRNMGSETETPKGTWDQAARQEVTSYRTPPPNRMTDTRF